MLRSSQTRKRNEQNTNAFCQEKYCIYMLRWKHNEKANVRDIEVTNEDPVIVQI